MEEILKSILATVEAHPGQSVESTIKTLGSKFNLTEDELSEILESFSILDSINEKAIDLENARKEGMTRNGWVTKQLETITEAAGDESVEVISQMGEGIENAVKELNKNLK